VKLRFLGAVLIAVLVWAPTATRPVYAIFCYPGDPPGVYQACVAYNGGIGQQVNNQNQLQNIQGQISNTIAQINAIDAMIASLNTQIAAQRALIQQTQDAIDDLNRKIRFGEASLVRMKAHVSVRDQLLNQRLRYVDSHGAINYVELVLTSGSFNQLMNRMVGAEQIAASDKRLLIDLEQQHSLVASDLEKNLQTQAAAKAFEIQLQKQLQDQYNKVQAERAAIDAQVAALSQQYAAAAAKAGGGSGVFEWPVPACGFGCMSQRFGCSSFYLEVYEPSCPWPHKIHSGIDIAAGLGTPIVAADTGVAYLYPGSVGYGNLLVIIHGNGYSTYYGHLYGYAAGLSTGQVIPRGTTAAFMGSTGWSTGSHLHFEIRVNGMYKDPCIWLGC
jgi:murein DD-endopeptidase MepM/ murein hydrolase activator NlpD